MSFPKTKVCNVCQRRKKREEFYNHAKMADGKLGKCKQCQRANVKMAKDRNREHYRQYDKDRTNNPDRVAARTKYAKTPEGVEARKRARQAYIERNPEKRKAHVMLGNAIRDNKITRPSHCERCGKRKYRKNLQAHHHDYSKPLEVTWLCDPCHKQEHK